jgi:hypothetical protein
LLDPHFKYLLGLEHVLFQERKRWIYASYNRFNV